MSTTIYAKDFKKRKDLEKYIRAEFGGSSNKNRENGYTIQGTRKEVKRLLLDDTRSVFGVRIEITDHPTKQKVKIKKNDKQKNIQDNKKRI